MEVAALNWAFCRDSAWFLCPWKHFGLISSPVFSPNVKFIKGSSQSLSNVPGSTNQKILKKQTKQQCISQTFLFPCNSIWLHCSHQLFSWAGIICMSTVVRLTHALFYSCRGLVSTRSMSAVFHIYFPCRCSYLLKHSGNSEKVIKQS